VSIGPGLIARREAITVTVLADGGEPARAPVLACHEIPFIDVQFLRPEQRFSPEAKRRRRPAAGQPGAHVSPALAAGDC
jgi:hypothetical protein